MNIPRDYVILMGLNTVYIMRKWRIPNDVTQWISLIFREANTLDIRCNIKPYFKNLVNILDIMWGQYSWYQMWYQNLLSNWWISLIFWEANTLDIRRDIKPYFWVIGEYCMIFWEANIRDIRCDITTYLSTW